MAMRPFHKVMVHYNSEGKAWREKRDISKRAREKGFRVPLPSDWRLR